MVRANKKPHRAWLPGGARIAAGLLCYRKHEEPSQAWEGLLRLLIFLEQIVSAVIG